MNYKEIVDTILTKLKNANFEYEYMVLKNETLVNFSATEWIANIGSIITKMVERDDLFNLIDKDVRTFKSLASKDGISYQPSETYSLVKKTFIIDGYQFNTLREFYEIIGEELVEYNNWGKNWNALNDILWGGFVKTQYQEPITLIWKNSEYSKNNLSDYNDIIELIINTNI